MDKNETKSSCCNAKITLSVSTLKGRRLLCNNCGTPQNTQPVTKVNQLEGWEYMEVKNESDPNGQWVAGLLSVDALNEYGKSGWQLATIVGYQYIFKRPISISKELEQQRKGFINIVNTVQVIVDKQYSENVEKGKLIQMLYDELFKPAILKLIK